MPTKLKSERMPNPIAKLSAFVVRRKQAVPPLVSTCSAVERVLALQRMLGNRGVQTMLPSLYRAEVRPGTVQRDDDWDPRYETRRARPGGLSYEDYLDQIGKPGAESYAPELKEASQWGGDEEVQPVALTLDELAKIMKAEVPPNADPAVIAQEEEAHQKRLQDYLPYINEAFETMGINTVKAQALYLAHTAGETGTLKYFTELPNSETAKYQPFVGRGPLHTTFEHGYVQTLAYLEKRKQQLEDVATAKQQEADQLKQQPGPNGENYALAALAVGEAITARKRADLAGEACRAIKGNLEEAANPRYSFLFGAAYEQMSGMVKRSRWLGDQASFAGFGLENVGMTGRATSVSMRNRSKIKSATYARAIEILSKKAVGYKQDYIRA